MDGKRSETRVSIEPSFNILLADIEEDIRNGRWGSIRLGKQKVFTLTYADDLVLLVESKDDMRTMRRLERYLEEKKLTLNVEKTKIVRFRKDRGRKKKIEWRWKGKKME